MSKKNDEAKSNKTVQIVIFRIGECHLSCPISQVREIIKLDGVTNVPSSPDMVRGVIRRRGNIITVLDYTSILGSGVKIDEEDSQLIILQGEDDENIGVMTSEVVEIPTKKTEDIEHSIDALETPMNKKYLKGVIRHDDNLVMFTDLLSLVRELPKKGIETVKKFGEEQVQPD